MASAATPASLAETASATLFVALELSRSTWLGALHSPLTNQVSQSRLDGGDADGLLALITRKRGQAEESWAQPVRVCAALRPVTTASGCTAGCAPAVSRTGCWMRPVCW